MSNPKALRAVAFAVIAAMVAALAAAGWLYWYADRNLEEVAVPSLRSQDPSDSASPTEVTNFLVVGNASRAGLTGGQLDRLGTTPEPAALTDAIMIVQLAPRRERLAMLSFPRDLRVDTEEGGYAKINSIRARGGPDKLVQTVERLTGVDLDHYVEIDMAGFLRVADVLGGVRICLDEPITDKDAGIRLPAGCQLLNRYEALGFVRSRKSTSQQFGNGDFGRMAKQQYFVRQALARATDQGVLLNPVRMKRAIDVAAENLVTDEGLGVRQMLRFATSLKDLDERDVVARTVPAEPRRIDGKWFVVADEQKAESMYRALRRVGAIPTSTQTADS